VGGADVAVAVLGEVVLELGEQGITHDVEEPSEGDVPLGVLDVTHK
jgi:hypothetical protein